MKKSLLIVFFFLVPTRAFAAEFMVEDFTRSLKNLYVTSELCKNALDMESEGYAVLIQEYLRHFYPEKPGYWVLPAVTPFSVRSNLFRVQKKCIVEMQRSLIEYKYASAEFNNNYPDEPPPPRFVGMLRANQNPELAFAKPDTKTDQTLHVVK